MSSAALQQVEKNYAAFQEKLGELMKTHPGKFALMRDGNVVAFFDTARDAYVAGQQLYETDKLFSIQEIMAAPVDLGYFSHAIAERPV